MSTSVVHLHVKEVAGHAAHDKEVGMLYDVFWGDGWRNWARVRIENAPPNKPVFTHVKGFGLPWNVKIGVSKHLKLT